MDGFLSICLVSEQAESTWCSHAEGYTDDCTDRCHYAGPFQFCSMALENEDK